MLSNNIRFFFRSSMRKNHFFVVISHNFQKSSSFVQGRLPKKNKKPFPSSTETMSAPIRNPYGNNRAQPFSVRATNLFSRRFPSVDVTDNQNRDDDVDNVLQGTATATLTGTGTEVTSVVAYSPARVTLGIRNRAAEVTPMSAVTGGDSFSPPPARRQRVGDYNPNNQLVARRSAEEGQSENFGGDTTTRTVALLRDCLQIDSTGDATTDDATLLWEELAGLVTIRLESATSHMRKVSHEWDGQSGVSRRHRERLEAAGNNNLADLQALGMNVDSVLGGLTEVYSPVVVQCLLGALSDLRMPFLSHGGNIAPRDETRQGLRTIDTNYKINMLFIPMMTRNKRVSVFNNDSKPEFWDGKSVYNPEFWEANVNLKRTQDGMFSSLEIGAWVPDWLVADSALAEHKLGMQYMAQHGPVMEDNQTYYLSLKKEYCTVFLRNMQSELVAAARRAGFFPVFALKNGLCQHSTRFGINGWQITTINLQPKSYLALVAFVKGKAPNLQIITLTNANSQVMVLANNRT